MRTARIFLTLICVATLSGCANLQSHDSRIAKVQASSDSGDPISALQQLESSAKTEDAKKELLFNLERGELLRMARHYADSTSAYMLADEQVKAWEETAKFSPGKLLGNLGATLISERLKTYEGQDYEKVMLTTRLALNRLAVGDLDNARVDIKRTHEREAVIAEFRAKELSAAEDEARGKGVKSIGRELSGYPVETLEDPAVLALKNGYQNALSHYLAGFVYEVLNEPGLAAPGYRKAIELNTSSPILDEGLRRLDQRTSFTHRKQQRMTDVLFVVESGAVPARKPVSLTVPVATAKGIVGLSMSYPAIEPSKSPPVSEVRLGNTPMKAQVVVDFNLMARRALKDEMLGMLLRGTVRAVAKGILQDQAQKSLGWLGGLTALVGAVATEQADDRMWRTLPERVYIARGYMPPGTHRVAIDGRELPDPLIVDGQYMIVPVRLFSSSIAMGDVGTYGQLPATSAVLMPDPEPETPKPVKASKGKRAASKAEKLKPDARAMPGAATGATGTKAPAP